MSLLNFYTHWIYITLVTDLTFLSNLGWFKYLLCILTCLHFCMSGNIYLDARHCYFCLVGCWIFCIPKITSEVSFWRQLNCIEVFWAFQVLFLGFFLEETKAVLGVGWIIPHFWSKVFASEGKGHEVFTLDNNIDLYPCPIWMPDSFNSNPFWWFFCQSCFLTYMHWTVFCSV